MRGFGFLMVMMCAVGTAWGQPTVDTLPVSPTWLPYTGANDASDRVLRIYHDGEVFDPPTAPAQRVFFDSLHPPSGDPNGLLNLALRDAGQVLVCPQFGGVPAEVGGLPLGTWPCDDPNVGGDPLTFFPGLGLGAPLEILFDEYLMDPTQADANQVNEVDFLRIPFMLAHVPSEPVVARFEVRWLEAVDYNNDGQLGETDGVGFDVLLEPNHPPGVSVIRVGFGSDPNELPFLVYGRGVLAIDLRSEFRDPETLVPVGPACGVYLPLAGGTPGDDGCTPNTQVVVGDVLGGAGWLALANPSQAASAGPPWDPNLLLPPADPNGLAYETIYQAGLLLQPDTGLAPGIPFQMANEFFCRGCGYPCGVGCEVPGGCGDLDLDGDVDLGDLAIVLGAFGSAGELADSNNDGSVDLTDLANVLALFGRACP